LKRPKKSSLAVTLSEPSTPGSRYESRIRTPGNGQTWLHRHYERIGSGTFGEVYKTVNMHTGNHYAVKVLRRVGMVTNDVAWRKDVLNEVMNLQKILPCKFFPNMKDLCLGSPCFMMRSVCLKLT
jgi:serine/threonine protein kinase